MSRFVEWYNTSIAPLSRRLVLGKDPAIFASVIVGENPKAPPAPLVRQICNYPGGVLNPKKHKAEIQKEFTMDGTQPIPRPKVSAMSEAVEQISAISESRSKNGLHSCPITNASDSGEGLPWAENPLSDDLLRSSHRCSKLRPKMNSDYLASDNLP